MKATTRAIYIDINSAFISHMVQMKASIPISHLLQVFQLYIPHGSDERRCLRFKKADVLALYIPHGSDER